MFQSIPKIRLFLNIFIIIEIFLGIALVATTYYHLRILETFLTENEQKMLSSKFFNIYILGFQIKSSFCCALAMWNNIWPRRYSETIELLLRVWLVFCFLIVVCAAAIIWNLYRSSESLVEGAEIILLKGIDQYYSDPEWKLLWDKLQYTKECCGVNNYQDWMNAGWLSDNVKSNVLMDSKSYDMYGITECDPLYLDMEYNDQQGLITQPQIVAPYACCKRNSKFCYQNYLPRKKRSGSGSNNLPFLNLTDINTEGCFALFSKHLNITLDTLLILITIAILIDILLCCITKYLMASNYKRCYREFYNDLCMFDDEGNALVVIKCPPKVKCITLEEPNTFSGSDIANIASSSEMCTCCMQKPDDIADANNENFEAKQKKNSYLVH